LGIYNNIHPSDDDNYFYCPVNDCPCHDHYFYDSSGNIYLDIHNDNNIRATNHNIYEFHHHDHNCCTNNND
jgi:hypothetical protein